MRAAFLRAIEAEDKASALRDAIADPASPARFEVDPEEFRVIPRAPFAYWASERMRTIFRELPRFEGDGRVAKVGLQTSDDFRFVRLWTEVPPAAVGQTWFSFAKGGKFSPFYADVYLVVNWAGDGAEISSFVLPNGRLASRPQNTDFYFRPGLTWPRRTNGLSFRVMPAGCIFADKGPAAFVEGEDPGALLALCAVVNSEPFGALVALQLARTELAQSYEVGLIQQTPVPELSPTDRARLAALARRAWSLKRSLDTRTETSHAFVRPALLAAGGARQAAGTLAERAARWSAWRQQVEAELAAIQAEIDDLCFDLYGLGSEDRAQIERGFGAAEDPEPGDADEDASDDGEADEDETEAADPGPMTASLLSWALGVAFGRFDVRLATGDRKPPPEPEPFDPLPPSSPGMLTGDDGLPVEGPSPGYPIASPPGGVLVDDQGHDHDLVARARQVFQVVFGDEADARWREAGEILGPRGQSLRAWLSGSFFEDHVKRYSKSRRKAPIYWQLATPSGSYSVWLYLHRFTRDTMYRVLNDYVTPKLAHEERKLTSLTQDAGPNPSASQRKELDAQERFLAELRAFRDEVARVAPLWNPDLNDGVIINFAPLWRLVPQHRAWQKECKKVWDKLARGDYDWAHLAMHLWPERVVPKCAKDRSLAIAHGLEDVFWEEDEGGKWKAKKVSSEVVRKLVEERTSAAVKAALDELLRAPAPAKASGGRRGGGRRQRAARAATSAPRAESKRTAARAAPDARTLEAVKQAIAAVSDGASKSDVVGATGISAGEWNAAIRELLAQGIVTKTGAARGTRYHLRRED